jgi:hypothetical protein
MDQSLVFTQIPIVVIANNIFACRVPICYKDTPMMEFVQHMPTHNTPTLTTKIPIFHSDGTLLAVVKGASLHATEDGKKAGVKLLHPPGGEVCELNGKTLFEIKRNKAAAISITAELFTNDGVFFKWSEKELSGMMSLAPNALKIGGLTMTGCRFSGDVGIQIGVPTTHVGGQVFIGLPAR